MCTTFVCVKTFLKLFSCFKIEPYECIGGYSVYILLRSLIFYIYKTKLNLPITLDNKCKSGIVILKNLSLFYSFLHSEIRRKFERFS